jgi:hypothetical protein
MLRFILVRLLARLGCHPRLCDIEVAIFRVSSNLHSRKEREHEEYDFNALFLYSSHHLRPPHLTQKPQPVSFREAATNTKAASSHFPKLHLANDSNKPRLLQVPINSHASPGTRIISTRRHHQFESQHRKHEGVCHQQPCRCRCGGGRPTNYPTG